MKKRKTPIIFFFFLILFLTSASAYTSFTALPGNNKNYVLGSNILDEETNVSFVTKSGDYTPPLVADMNNDGTYEVLTAKKPGSYPGDFTLYAYQGNTLTEVDSVILNTSGSTYISNFEIVDLDGDGNEELYYVSMADGKIGKVELNSTDQFESTVLTTIQGIGGFIPFLSCNSDYGICSIVANDGRHPNHYVYASCFNSTGGLCTGNQFTNWRLIYEDEAAQDGLCLPKNGYFPLGDWRLGDDYIEVFIPILDVDDTAILIVDNYMINPANLSDNANTGGDTQNLVGADFGDSDSLIYCDSEQYNYYITSPLVGDFDGTLSNGYEFIVGVSYGGETYKMFSYESDFTQIDDYPETGTATGGYLSNPVPAKAFQTNFYEDFCMMGYNIEDSTMLCGSILNTDTVFLILSQQHIELDIEEPPHNISDYTYGVGRLFDREHALYEITSTTGTGYSEFATTYGTYYIDYSDDDIQLKNLFYNPISSFSPIMVNINNGTYEDYLGTTETNLIYLSSSAQNSNCEDYNCIESININPCHTIPIELNTTMGITVQASDFESDAVTYNITVYHNSPYPQTQTFTNEVSGGLITAFFDMNVTTRTGQILVEVWDSQNPTNKDTWTYTTLYVLENGFQYGQSSCEVTFEHDLAAIGQDPITVASAEQNIVKGALDDVKDMSGIEETQEVWYLILIIIIAFMIFGAIKQQVNMLYTSIAIAMFSLLWVFIGSFFGFVPLGHLIVIIIILFLGLAVTFTVMIGANRGSGGG